MVTTGASPAKAKTGAAMFLGTVVVLALLAGYGWFMGERDKDLTPTPPDEEHNVLITFEAVWGLLMDTGELGENDKPIREFHPDTRPLTIAYHINGEVFEGNQNESDSESPGIWRYSEAVPVGSIVSLRVHQRDSGYLLCNIKQDESAVALSTINKAGWCEVEHVVFGMP